MLLRTCSSSYHARCFHVLYVIPMLTHPRASRALFYAHGIAKRGFKALLYAEGPLTERRSWLLLTLVSVHTSIHTYRLYMLLTCC